MKKTDFFRFENKNDDFPFYNDEPSAITFMQSLFLLMVSIGSAILFQFVEFPSLLAPFVNILFPLSAFILVTKSNWNKIFRKIHFKDIILVFVVLIFNLVITIIVANFIIKFFGANGNPAATTIQTNSLFDNIVFLLKTIPMLFGEELFTIIPFLVILQFSTKVLKTSRKKAVAIAWIVSAIIFGAIHLPTYNWNFMQSILGIGIVRLILTFPYVKTKNIWISFFVHVLNDWCLFLIPVLISKLG